MEIVGAIEEITQRKWGQVFAYREYIDILREGTDMPPKEPQRKLTKRTRSTVTRSNG
jgi:hypothetical protein